MEGVVFVVCFILVIIGPLAQAACDNKEEPNQLTKDTVKLFREICDVTNYGKDQDGPCIKELEDKMVQNHIEFLNTTIQNRKRRIIRDEDRLKKLQDKNSKPFEFSVERCTEGYEQGGEGFKRICEYVRVNSDVEAKVMCVSGLTFAYKLKNQEKLNQPTSMLESFQKCQKGNTE